MKRQTTHSDCTRDYDWINSLYSFFLFLSFFYIYVIFFLFFFLARVRCIDLLWRCPNTIGAIDKLLTI